METFKVEGAYIELIKLIKFLSWTESGGQAKLIVEQEEVRVDGEVETRKRAKLSPGKVVSWGKQKVQLV